MRELGDRVGLSDAPVQRRLRALEREGWIQGYVALVDPILASRDFTVFLTVEVEPESLTSRSAVERDLAALAEVVECHRITGSSSYFVKVVTSNTRTFEAVDRQIMAIPGFRRATRHVSLAQLKVTTALPLPARARDL